MEVPKLVAGRQRRNQQILRVPPRCIAAESRVSGPQYFCFPDCLDLV